MADNEKKVSGSAKKPNGFVAFCKKAVKFFRDCKGEVKKIVWPAPRSVFKSTGVVIVVVAVLGLFVFGLDTLFMNLLGLVMNMTGTGAG